MQPNEEIQLSRDVEAVRIPDGTRTTLTKGTRLKITQSLGDMYTIFTEQGYMFRIEGKNADAIGKEVVTSSAAPVAGALTDVPLEKLVESQLRTCYDPEIPVNILDLGLIYSQVITPLKDGGNRVEIEMTLTAPGCGMGPVLQDEVRAKVSNLPGVTETDVRLVFSPPWGPDRMSDAAKLQLGMM
ncbi:MAG: putative Fe-S cluster assembly protein SufT [Candidatus Omnitrophica bacterium]|nr:putative Fe-S cluster assembly protein SufT [Candidatus Omnitrophota bacterium]